jgi:3-deoxy-manno-octulosonate cytidylyltransferase (CMP-KDO synthetase)
MSKNVIVIPARYNSSRFPGKPLELINGKSLIERVWYIAKSVQGIDEVYIATDDARIESHAVDFSAKVIMTEDCENGTERVFRSIDALPTKPEVIFNLQGDAVLTPPWVIQSLVDTMVHNPHVEMATPATRITRIEYSVMQESKLKGEVGGTMVVCDKMHNALYFSKSMIPYLRQASSNPLPLYRHVGLYAYRYAALKKYIGLESTPLEKLEGLEQLRALENGIPIRVVFVDYRGRTHASIDSLHDVKRVEVMIKKEGELVPFNK